MGRNARIVIGVIVLVIGVLLLVSYLGNIDSETRTETFSGISEIEFDVENSPIDVVAGGDEVVVDISVTTGILGGGADLEQVGGTLRIEQDCPGFFLLGWGCRASFEVIAPADVSLSGSTSNGEITVVSLDGPVDVTTSNGAVVLDEISSSTTVRTSNGSITGTAMTSEDFRGTTSNGSVSLSFREAPASLTATSSNGSIEVLLPSDAPAYAVSTSTSNGQVLTEVRTDPSAESTIDVRTSNGDITVSYGG
jgi:hypothetical protein